MIPHRFSAGFLSVADAAALSEMSRTLAGQAEIQVCPPLSVLRQGFNRQPVITLDTQFAAGGWFPAELLSGTEPYDWVERVETSAGTWDDGTRAGTENAYQAVAGTGTPPTPAENDLVLMRASPTVAGAYEFLSLNGTFSGLTRAPVDFCVTKSGGNVTGIKVTWLKKDGTLECEDLSECTGGEGTDCNTVWYCVDGVATEVEVADAPPAGTVVTGPYPDEATALEICPPIAPTCTEADAENLPDILTITFDAAAGVCSESCEPGAISGSTTLTRLAPATNVWDGQSDAFCPGVDADFSLQCVDDIFTLSWTAGSYSSSCPDGGTECSAVAITGTVTPFSLTFELPVCCVCSEGTTTGSVATLVITE